MKHLPAGTRVKLSRTMRDEETCCGEYDKGTSGILVDEDGDMAFRPDGYPIGWGFYLDREDYDTH